jgi:hypothetical protein
MKIRNIKTVYVSIIQKLLTFVMFLFLFSTSSGQRSRDEIPPLKERLFYGGNFSLQIGTITNIDISPIIGLWVLPKLAVAIGPTYIFYKDNISKTDIFGGRSYIQYVLLRDIDKFIPLGIHTSVFLHLEDEMLSLDSEFWGKNSVTTSRFLMNRVLSGAGLSQQVGERLSFNFMVLWALTDSGSEIYSNPEIRIGFVF